MEPDAGGIHPAKPPGGGVYQGLLVLGVVGLSVACVLLVRRVWSLEGELMVVQQALARERTRDSLATGESLAPITVQRRDGSASDLSFAGEVPTIVFLIAGHCPYCDETVPVWAETATATRALETGRVRLVTIQTDARRSDALKDMPPGFEPVFVPAQAGTWLVRVPISPGAMLIDTRGVVRRTWFGMPSERDRQELTEAMLGVLPGESARP